MVTGVECAGLALAVLPLFVEVAKAYSGGVNSIKNVVVKSRWSKDLEDFYFDFYLLALSLDRSLQKIRQHLGPQHSRTENEQLLTEWSHNTTFQNSLRGYFGSDSGLNAFIAISERLLRLLGGLVKDKASRITDSDQRKMLIKLQDLVASREQNSADSSLVERLEFYRHAKIRNKCTKQLQRCVDELDRLTREAENSSNRPIDTAANNGGPVITSKTPPTLDLRDLIANLYPIIEAHRRCSCIEGHEIKLSLKDSYETLGLHPCLELDFLFSGNFDGSSNRGIRWQEGNIMVTSQCLSGPDSHTTIDKLCQACLPDASNYSITLAFEALDGKRSMKQLKPTLRKLRFDESPAPVSWGQLLNGPIRLYPIERRRLALIFAQSLLIFHDTEWLAGGWSKDNICFFFRSQDEPEVNYPFLSAQSHQLANDGTSLSIKYHPNPSILALGILMIEIFEEKPIEWWRLKDESAWIVADRAVKGMDHSPHREAIEACLDLRWVPAGCSAALENQETRAGLLKHIILPLEREIRWLSAKKPF